MCYEMSERSTLDRILERGEIRVAVDFTGERHMDPKYGAPPEMYIDEETGKPAGIVIELMKIMAEDLGVKPEFVDLPWGEQIDALLSGKVDILPKHTNTPQRALKFDFANKLFPLEVIILVPRDSPAKRMEDLNKKGNIILCEKGSSNKQIIEKNFPLATIREVFEEVKPGERWDARVEAAITKIYLENHPEVMILRDERGKPIILSREYAHPGIRANDQKFLNWINNWISFHTAQGTIQYWCYTYWQSFMAE
jgi:ABC-type amino acid transport substrate-binding protein